MSDFAVDPGIIRRLLPYPDRTICGETTSWLGSDKLPLAEGSLFSKADVPPCDIPPNQRLSGEVPVSPRSAQSP